MPLRRFLFPALLSGSKQMAKFKPGQSGNPNGRPKDTIAPLARAKGKEAFETLVKLLKSKDENIRLKASIAILERGFGKPTQPIEGDLKGEIVHMGVVKVNGKPLEVEIG